MTDQVIFEREARKRMSKLTAAFEMVAEEIRDVEERADELLARRDKFQSRKNMLFERGHGSLDRAENDFEALHKQMDQAEGLLNSKNGGGSDDSSSEKFLPKPDAVDGKPTDAG
jgi:hypothetical protein